MTAQTPPKPPSYSNVQNVQDAEDGLNAARDAVQRRREIGYRTGDDYPEQTTGQK